MKITAGLEVDAEKSLVANFNKDPNKPEIHLVLKKNNRVVAIIEAIKNTNENLLLPNNQKYFMLYRDVSRFNFESSSGEVKLIDLNYDSHVFNKLDYENGKNTNAIYTPIPDLLLEKHSKIIEHNREYLESKINSQSKITDTHVPCDYNSNGDLSFSECYRCFNSACQTNSDCYTLCYGIGDVVGWLAAKPGIPYCQTAIGASCIYLAIAY